MALRYGDQGGGGGVMVASFPCPYEYEVEPSPEHVVQVRRLLVDIVTAWGLPLSGAAIDDLKLCATEVVTNAVTHTEARCKISVRWTGRFLRVEVWDSSLKLPAPTKAKGNALNGRGLALVEAFAHAWGWKPSGAGKTVWFDIGSDQIVTGDQRLSTLVRVAQAQVA